MTMNNIYYLLLGFILIYIGNNAKSKVGKECKEIFYGAALVCIVVSLAITFS